MEKTLALRSGSIILAEDRIIVKDGFRSQKILLQIIAVFWIAFSLIHLYRYSQTQDVFYLWSGLVLGILNIAVLLLFTRLSAQEVILHTDIQEVQLKKRLGGMILILKLNNKLRRQVAKVEHLADEITIYCHQYKLPLNKKR
ncbi:MAG: hypothetical protein H6555_01790 [Lewinellaceae bacterium]|nr:hypothetical protein [Lewinellaceae bacterium]